MARQTEILEGVCQIFSYVGALSGLPFVRAFVVAWQAICILLNGALLSRRVSFFSLRITGYTRMLQ